MRQIIWGAEEFNIWGTIVFKGRCQIGTGGKITVGTNGVLVLGDECNIMSQCDITAYKLVDVGDNLLMAHASQIFDTGYHYVADFNKRRVKQIGTAIIIGSNCWICNSSTVMGGTQLPNYTIVASHSLVNKDFSKILEESIVGGMPARVIATGYRKIDNSEMQKSIENYFAENPESADYIFENDVNHNLF